MLKTSTKLQAIYSILNHKPISFIIDELSVPEIVDFQKYIWDITVEFGIQVRGKKFTRKDVTRKMPSTDEYQRNAGCSEKVYYCKGTHCINTNQVCATNKIKLQVDIMADVIQEFIQSVYQNELLE